VEYEENHEVEGERAREQRTATLSSLSSTCHGHTPRPVLLSRDYRQNSAIRQLALAMPLETKK